MITHTLRICNSDLHSFVHFVVLHKLGVRTLDIMLERILSLIPHKPNGKFVHGAVKDFATGLGLKSGNIVSDWIANRSQSYESYIYQISAKYGVSVEWLKGETDEKKPTPVSESGLAAQKQYDRLTPENQAKADSYLAFLLASQDNSQT